MTLKRLLEEGIVKLARLPAMNDISLEQLDSLKGYTVPLVAHDYGAKTPVMWNTVYSKLGLPLRNIMVVADPANAKDILDDLRNDPKYLGGGAGVGFKETILAHLDSKQPADLSSVNIIVKEKGKLVGYNTDAQGLYKSVEDALQNVEGYARSVKDSNFIVLGAGGVAKQFVRALADGEAARIGIVNRTMSKAVALAHELNMTYGRDFAYGIPEDLIRGAVLNTTIRPHAIINTTDKGSDGALVDISAFAIPNGTYNNTVSIDILRDMAKWNPRVVIVDIVLANMRSVTLRHADSAGLRYLVDGKPMVVNQAAPAYTLVQNAHASLHAKKLDEEAVLALMRDAAK